ncbi:MAG: patatin-like phospholipase family protein [Chromatiales bacterium]|nr:patatin-like phospholipase family protein [Chromatiales bacterium]
MVRRLRVPALAALVTPLLACSLLGAAQAAEPRPAGVAPEPAPAVKAGGRPRIGLVLGGGGAKGAAHIGVLRVLDELRIPISCVTGTSMGALVGATFASGMPPADIERNVLAINWAQTVGSEGLRDRTPIARKLGGITYTNTLDLGLKGGRVTAPGGLLKTQDIEDVIRALVSDARFTRDFDDLPVPFRAVATDMKAGEMVILESGDLSVAMRASMAVPGAFSPVVMGDRILSDGGMMRNLPVDVARDLCADVVIAVSLSSPPPEAQALMSAVALAGRALDVMIDANQNAQIATLTEADVSIVVPMGDIGSASFDRVPDAIPLGKAAAREHVAELQRFAVPEAEYLAWRQAVTRPGRGVTRLADVRVNGLNRVNPAFVESQLQKAQPGAEVTTVDIVEDTRRIYALGDFERVAYRLEGPPDARVLEIDAYEKSWGPDFVRFDLGLAANGDGQLQAILRGDHRRTWLNSRGGEWRNALQLGFDTVVGTDFYQPLDVRQRFFVRPGVRYERILEDIYSDGDRLARYNFSQAFGELDVGLNLGTRAQLTAGLRRGSLRADRDTGPEFLPELDSTDDAQVRLGLTYDTRDAVLLPTRGTFVNARFIDSGSWLSGELDYSLVEGVITRSFPFRGDALTLALSGGREVSGELPVVSQFRLGGIRSFPGLKRGELRGTSYWYATSAYNWKLADIQSLFGQALYAGLRLQAGRMGGRIDVGEQPVPGFSPLTADGGTLYGISGNLSGRTPIGSFILSLGYVSNDSWQLQFAVGRPITEGSILDDVR